MRRRSLSPLALAALASVGLAACPTAPIGPSDAGGDSNRPVNRVEIGTRGDDGTFTPWSDEEIIPLVWGPQGGVMVTPAVAIDGCLVPVADPALILHLSNHDPETGDLLVEHIGFGPVTSVFARLGSRLVHGPIFDQLGWSDIGGRRVLIRAHLEGMGIEAQGEVTIMLGAAGAMPPTPG